MKEPRNKDKPPKLGAYQPGTYLRCSACGRLLKIEWATRSIVCSCGVKIDPNPPAGPEK